MLVSADIVLSEGKDNVQQAVCFGGAFISAPPDPNNIHAKISMQRFQSDLIDVLLPQVAAEASYNL